MIFVPVSCKQADNFDFQPSPTSSRSHVNGALLCDQRKRKRKLHQQQLLGSFQSPILASQRRSGYNAKTVSLLGLLEELGVKEVDAFTTRSESVLRKMVVFIANTITEKIVKKIKKSEAFGLLTDEVTDISNVQQLVSFIQFFDEEIGDCVTKFIETADLLESSHNSFPDADAIFSCLVKLLQKHGLDLNELKGFGSDGASVLTGRHRGVSAKFESLEECKTMINIHCVCHHLALACADTGDELKFIQDFEKTALELWSFFKKSPKRLKIYIKVTLGVRNFDAMS